MTVKNEVLESKQKLMELFVDIMPYLDQVNDFIDRKVRTNIELLNTVEEHIFRANGKRIRPVLHLLASLICGEITHSNIVVAAASEIIHTATLLHDDVIDNSATRRGKRTVNDIWGNELSVMVGDYFYSLSMNSLINVGRLDVVSIFSQATQLMSEGEIIQHANLKNINLTDEQYIDVIRRKTAVLFSACCHTAAVLANLPEDLTEAWINFGNFLGISFQLIDDLLDYTGGEKITGKTPYNDLYENKMTMPLLHAIKSMTDAEKEFITAVFDTHDKNEADIERIVRIVKENNGIDFTRKLAWEYEELAIAQLSPFRDSPFYETMVKLARYIIERKR